MFEDVLAIDLKNYRGLIYRVMIFWIGFSFEEKFPDFEHDLIFVFETMETNLFSAENFFFLNFEKNED